MKFTKFKAEFWKEVQLNAGIAVKGFDPADGSYTGILGVTGGGMSFNPNPTYEDFGADIDNVPPNTKQMKRIKYYDPALSGTFRSIDQDTAELLCPGAESSGVITPASALSDAMFQDVALIADYSDVNADDPDTLAKAGYMAVVVKNALNTSGFQWKTNKDGKGEFAFDFHGHYDLSNPDDPPFDIYIVEPTPDATTLKALTVASVAGTAAGASKITVTGHTLQTGQSYVYKTDTSAAPTVTFNALPGEGWAALTNGGDITPTSGHTKIGVALVNSQGKAIGYGSATLVTNTGT